MLYEVITSVFATVLGAIYGIPFLWYLSQKGISFGTDGSEMGIIMAEKIIPVYGIGRITSYNVCYTKLLRFFNNYTRLTHL